MTMTGRSGWNLRGRWLRRDMLPCALMGLALSLVGMPAGAQEAAWPARSVRLLVPFPPGGAADVFARAAGERLGPIWKQPVVVENRPGAGGRIATQTLLAAPADGYSLMVVTVGHAVNPALYKSLPYNTLRDLRPVAMLATVPNMLVVNPALPARSVAELVTLARTRPGGVTYASSGNATTSHVAGALLAGAAGVNLLHVPYKGSAPALTDLISGQVDFMIDPVATAIAHVRAGRLRALAVSSSTRSALVPELPTIAESGVPGYDFSAWFMLLASSAVPGAVVERINADVQSLMRDDAFVKGYADRGAVPGAGTPAELASFLEREVARFAELVRVTGMQAD